MALADGLLAVRWHGSKGILRTARPLLLRWRESWLGMIEDPEPFLVGQIDQAAAGILEDASHSSKRLEHLGVRGIAKVEDLNGLSRIVRAPDDPLGVLVRNFGEAHVGTYHLEVARRGVVRGDATVHQARKPRFRHVNDRKALLGCLLDIQ